LLPPLTPLAPLTLTPLPLPERPAAASAESAADASPGGLVAAVLTSLAGLETLGRLSIGGAASSAINNAKEGSVDGECMVPLPMPEDGRGALEGESELCFLPEEHFPITFRGL
jgi:hypothetical protein